MGEILIILLIVGAIFVMRLIGSWMFRINEVIDLQKEANLLQKKSIKINIDLYKALQGSKE